MSTPTSPADQASLPLFRISVVVQLLAAGFFGLFPLLAASTFAALFGYTGDAPLAYTLFGASTTGYAVAAAYYLWKRPGWSELRIPLVATLAFNVSAFLASALEVVSPASRPAAGGASASLLGGYLPVIVLLASGAFSVIAFYWLRRDEGPLTAPAATLSRAPIAILGLATLSAAVFGVLPLVVPGQFASVFGLPGTDVYIYRLAGAATLGYAVAGWLEMRAASLDRIRVQNLAAIVFTALGAIVSVLAFVGGYGGSLAPLIVLAAGFFAVTLTLIQLGRIR